jgi:hypothetical protein
LLLARSYQSLLLRRLKQRRRFKRLRYNLRACKRKPHKYKNAKKKFDKKLKRLSLYTTQRMISNISFRLGKTANKCLYSLSFTKKNKVNKNVFCTMYMVYKKLRTAKQGLLTVDTSKMLRKGCLYPSSRGSQKTTAFNVFKHLQPVYNFFIKKQNRPNHTS